jgi:hypothetical protein
VRTNRALVNQITDGINAKVPHPKLVHGTMNFLAAAIQEMGIDHHGADVSVPQKLLDGADIVAVLQMLS